MKAHLDICLFLGLILASPSALPQEEPLFQEEVVQDDLGNVTDEFQEHFFEALKQKAIENHEKAIASLTKCLAIDPKPVVYFELGKNYKAMERYGEASVYLEKAREMEPQNEAVLTELYNTYYQDQQFDKALPVLESLQQLDPLFSEELANLYILDEKFEEALALLDSLESKWGKSDYRERLRAQIFSHTGNVDARVLQLEEKVAEDPQDEKSYLELVLVHSEMGNAEKAYEIAKNLLEKNPNSELLHLALYRFYLDRQEIEEALNSIKIIFEGNEIGETSKYQVLSDFLLFMEENPSLEDELMEVVEMLSEKEANTGLYSKLGDFFLGKNDKDNALIYFEKGIEAGAMDYDLLIKTILLQLDFNKFEEAKQLSENALEEYPAQSLLYLVHGTALNHLKDHREAVEILTFGLDYIIDNRAMEADFYRQLAFAYNGLEEAGKASEYERKAAKLKTESTNE